MTVGADNSRPFYASKAAHSSPPADFTLTDQNGAHFSSTSLRGKIALISFGFTNCPNICPTTLAHLANVDKALTPEEQKQIQVVFISVDPQHDTPAVLKSYVHFFDDHFIGLTGRVDQVEKVANSFGAETSDYNVGHTTGVYLVGRSGAFIGYYRENQLGATERVVDDLRRFLAFGDDQEQAWQAEKVHTVKFAATTGRQAYLEQCASCHLDNGRGIAGKYPSLVQSHWVLGAPNRLVALTLDGVSDARRTADASYKAVMPAYRTVLTPRLIAAVLTYIRQSWGNSALPISTRYVEKLVSGSPIRSGFWSWEALKALPAEKGDDAMDEDPAPSANEDPDS